MSSSKTKLKTNVQIGELLGRRKPANIAKPECLWVVIKRHLSWVTQHGPRKIECCSDYFAGGYLNDILIFCYTKRNDIHKVNIQQ
jgi:hypothetical protein